METLEELKVNELNDINDYPEDILLLIRDKMISKQLRIEYKTLCEECHNKIHGIESKTDAYREEVYNPYGDYFFLNISSILDLDTQYALRFLYLCCFINYKNDLTYGNAKKGYNQINVKDLQEVFNFSKRETIRTKKIFIENKLIQLDKNNNLMTLNKNIVYKGFKPNGNTQYIRFFSEFIKNLYKELVPTEHKTIGRIFKLLSYVSDDNCITSIKGKPINATDICKILGYDSKVAAKIQPFLKHNVLIRKDNFYFVNPNFTYNGFLTKKLKYIINHLDS